MKIKDFCVQIESAQDSLMTAVAAFSDQVHMQDVLDTGDQAGGWTVWTDGSGGGGSLRAALESV